jgi:hypothetical protein
MERTDDVSAQPQAGGALNAMAQTNRHAARELNEAQQSRIHLLETAGDERQAGALADDKRKDLAAETTKADPAGVRVLTCWLGATLVAVLAALDVAPLNWGAQAFGLAIAGTWLITGILLVASLAAMLGFELTRANPRKRLALIIALVLAYGGLLLLRVQFLLTVEGESFGSALLQAALLTAVSAGLVLAGSAVMARTQHFRVAKAKAAVRRAEQVAENHATKRGEAEKRLRRHVAVLRSRVNTSMVPAGADPATWAATLEREIQALFPEQ